MAKTKSRNLKGSNTLMRKLQFVCSQVSVHKITTSFKELKAIVAYHRDVAVELIKGYSSGRLKGFLIAFQQLVSRGIIELQNCFFIPPNVMAVATR